MREDLVIEATRLLAGKGSLISLPGSSAVVIGDTHGFPEVSQWALRLWDRGDYEYLVFLGDYVDRGPRGLENLETVLEAFLSEPGRIVLLRGNHESPTMNYFYGFYEEAVRLAGPGLYNKIARLYTYLPYVATLNGWLLVHGGVPCRACREESEEPLGIEDLRLELVRAWANPDIGLEPSQQVAFQLLWNDPRGSIEWFAPSIRGEGAYFYGRKAWTSFLKKNRLRGIIRAHEVVDAFHIWLPDGRGEQLNEGVMKASQLEGAVITVFSSLYHGMRAGALIIDGEDLIFKAYNSL